MTAAARLLLVLLRIEDATPEQDAAAHLFAFGLQDLRALRLLWEG